MANNFSKILGVGVSLLAMTAPSLAQTCVMAEDFDYSPSDIDRIARLDEVRARALEEAKAAASGADKKLLATIVMPPAVAVDEIPVGLYKCRTIKMGGNLPIATYPYFECFVSEMGTEIEKLTGSQRFVGTLHDTGSGAVFYKGAINYASDETAFWYGEDATRDQVGCVYQIAGKTPRYRLELPLPLYESSFDVIELVPAN